jgi:peptidoglycan/LPS O-acetylase OafA/YrhL
MQTSSRFPSGYDAALDAFRLLAALLVMFSHYLAGYLDIHVYFYGYTGFMVAAGYFAYRYAIGRYSGKDYFIARLVRLYPAFLLAALGYWLVLRGEQTFDDRTLVNHLLFLTTATDQSQVMALNSSFWVLPAFVEFYLLFALIGAVIHPALLFLAGILLIAIIGAIDDPVLRVLRLHIPYSLYVFALGGCLAWLRKELCDWRLPFLPPLIVALFCLLAMILVGSDQFLFGFDILEPAHLSAYRKSLFVLLYAGALFALLYSDRSLFQYRWLGLLAGASFSIYLFHNLIRLVLPIDQGWVGLGLATLGTIMVALVVQALVEDPIRKRYKAWTQHRRDA